MARGSRLERQAWQIVQAINGIDDDTRIEVYKHYMGEDSLSEDVEKIRKVDFSKVVLASRIEDKKPLMTLQEKVILSTSTMRKSLSDIKTMGKWIRDNYFEGKRFQYNKIETNMIDSFLEHKRDVDMVSPSTLKTYKMSIYKMIAGMEKLGWYKNSIDLYQVKGFQMDTRIPKDRELTNNQVSVMLDYVRENRDSCMGNGPHHNDYGAAMLLQSQGLRIQSLVDIKSENILLGMDTSVETSKWGTVQLNGDYIYIEKGQDKGGLDRYVKVDSSLRPLLEELKQKQGKVFYGMNAAAYRGFMGRLTTQLFDRKVTCTHELRKYWASTQFIERKELHEMETGRPLTKSECMAICEDIVSKIGHGKGRKDLYKTYIFSAFGWS